MENTPCQNLSSLQTLFARKKIMYFLCQKSLEYFPNSSLLNSTRGFHLQGKQPPRPLSPALGLTPAARPTARAAAPATALPAGGSRDVAPLLTASSPHPTQVRWTRRPSQRHARSPRTLPREVELPTDQIYILNLYIQRF